MTVNEGNLYVVATPIGNLADISERAVETLRRVDRIAAEDTRHTARLLNHLSIQKPLVSLHEHNEAGRITQLMNWLQQGESIALVSDAGTPLISDPGYELIRAITQQQYAVTPVPGPCALIVALCASGLPTDRFYFTGFLPAKGQSKLQRLQQLAGMSCTWIAYESSHRIVDTLERLCDVAGAEREVVLARELTKRFETFLRGTAEEVSQQLKQDPNQQKGEFVLMVRGMQSDDVLDEEAIRTLDVLLEELPLKQAAKLAAKRHGLKKKQLYDFGLAHR